MLPTDPQDLVKLAIDIIIDQIEKRGPRLINKVQQEIKNRRKKQAHVPWVELVNRESERRAIQRALDDAHSRILYFVGEGGTGKTRLLQEAKLSTSNGNKPSKSLRWAGLLDFYHTELHNITAVQVAIIQGLDPAGEYFQKYRRSQERFHQLLEEGFTGLAIEEERQRLSNLFLEEYHVFARKYRPVIAFDTLESLTHESDWVERLCSLEDMPIASREWLIQQINKLENSVILMAGRPQPSFQRALERVNHHDPGQLELIELRGLTREDTRQLLAMLLREAPAWLKSLIQNADELWKITRGLPVQVALVLELAAAGRTIVRDIVDDPEGIESSEQRLVSELFSSDNPDKHIFLLLGLARKGMTADLLHYLEPEVSITECKRHLEKLRSTSIVKTRPEIDALFLHDALYELFDAYPPPPESLIPWYERLIDYYRAQHLRSDPNKQQHSQTAINLLYYELRRNSRYAFDSVYLRLREEALQGYELELELQLRDELLRFFHSPITLNHQSSDHKLTEAEIDRDGVVRWIKRYIIQAKYQEAIRVAETILSLGPNKFKSYIAFSINHSKQDSELPSEVKHKHKILSTTEPLFWGQLLACYCEGLIYSSAREIWLEQILKKASTLVENAKLKSDDSLKWLYERTLGRLNDRKGYLLRINGHYDKAIRAYEQARLKYQSADISSEMSTTLNNLAFTLALLGESKRATTYVNQALELRQHLGQQYPLALSYNTRGLIYALQEQYERGRKDSQLALNIFEELETPRGVGLAYNALGYILRKQGEGWKAGEVDVAQAVNYFQQSIGYLVGAEEIFSKQVSEPIRLWEAYNELGSLHREWGRLLDDQSKFEAAQTQYAKAFEYQLKALKTVQEYGMHFQEADTYDDLAKVSRDQGNYQQAKRWLKRALSLVPKEYTLQTGKKGKHIPPAGEAYWLILGKVSLQKGIWALESLTKGTLSERRHQEYTQSVFENFALASYYLERYWPGTSANQRHFRSMADQIWQLGLPVREIKRAIKAEGIHHNINVSAFLEVFSNRSVQ